ncbi:acyl-CoA N-acyltransferase [Rickenella mellea]|uniref:Acyl-CoA N-acyltransferase n=1 Tax=Rickenella mellea TaxID=50990 RepID=A0A4Y7QGN6_9AGAM|nr:acyl-CoA N-acyltransferase [Rickenella mellea]
MAVFRKPAGVFPDPTASTRRKDIAKDLFLKSSSGRLLLAPPKPDEDAEVSILRSHPETLRYQPYMPASISPDEVRERREKRAQLPDVIDQNVFLLAFNEEGIEEWKLVGMTGLYNIDQANLSCFSGILVDPSYFREGIASETLLTLLTHAFEDSSMHMHRVTFHTGVDNVRMRTWLEELGVREEFIWKESWKVEEGVWVDTVGYPIFEGEWRANVKEALKSKVVKALKGYQKNPKAFVSSSSYT